jgi:hypothetical protein
VQAYQVADPHAMDHRRMRTPLPPEGICGEPGAR